MTARPAAAHDAQVLAAFVAAVLLQRGLELMISHRHAHRLSARGGRLVEGDGFGLIVLVHALYPILLVAEVVTGVARPGPDWPVWSAIWLAAQTLRYASMRALGDRWTVRVWTVPREPRVTRGPYRWLTHPNYVAVVAELVAGPLMFGAWRTALAVSLLNGVALGRRIRAEDAALRKAV